MTIIKTIYTAIFGKNYGPVWKQFAEENKGVYIPSSEERVEIIYKEHKIIFDTYTHYNSAGGSSRETEFVRVRLEYLSVDNLKLVLIPQGIFENIGKLFGSQDILIGNTLFDKKYMIKGNDDYKIQLILSTPSLQKLLMEQELTRLEITNTEGLFDEKVNKGKHMLYFVSENKVTQIEQLNALHTLFLELIQALIKVNSMK